jgi:serine/threonine protein kinase
LRHFLLRIPNLDGQSTTELYERFGKPSEVPIRRVDGKSGEPHAPPLAIFPMALSIPANKEHSPEIIISDYGTSFNVSETPTPTLYTPALYSPPEDFLNEPINQPTAADIWTLGVNLYEVLGERPLFETFAWDRDDIVGQMINTLGQPPARWWNSWAKRSKFFEDGSWVTDFRRIHTPVFRRLRQRLWDMGRGETEQTCEWDVAGGEQRALEDFLRAMMTFEPAERPSADQLLGSEYMVKWALPAWERQKRQKSAHTTEER